MLSLPVKIGVAMFLKKKIESKINIEQHELMEYAHNRIQQKKRLYTHFVIFIIGSAFLFLINKALKLGGTHNWFAWAILLWAFLFVLHFFNVFVTQKFMGKDWERKQREKLVFKQKERITELQKKIETDFPLSSNNNKKE